LAKKVIAGNSNIRIFKMNAIEIMIKIENKMEKTGKFMIKHDRFFSIVPIALATLICVFLTEIGIY